MGTEIRRLIVVLISAVAFVTGAISPTVAASGETVDFEGSGWGHGVGMSQWGAQALALQGWNYGQILTHYFRGTSLQTLSAGETIWVNLEEKFTALTLTALSVGASPAPVQVTNGSQDVNAHANAVIKLSTQAASGCTVEITNPGSGVQSLTSNPCSIDFTWYAWETNAQPTTKIQIEGCTLTDWNTSPSTQRPCQYARGQLHLRRGTSGLYLSAEMRIDDYVLGISEVPRTWHVEAQKAQSVAARSYAMARARARGNPSASDYNGCWCHVRDTTADQRYAGWGHTVSQTFLDSVSGTARRVLTHPDSTVTGNVIATYYSSSSGGRTEYGHIKGFSHVPVEWLTSVDDSHAVDGSVPNPNRSWVKSVKPDTVAQSLGFDSVTSVRVISRRPGSGSAAEVRIWGILNDEPVSAVKTSAFIRGTYGLKSDYFSVNYTAPLSSQLHQPGDEMLFYKTNGTFRYYSVHPNGALGAVIEGGSGYTSGWKSVSAVDLNGDAHDEILFYREDGLYRFYEIGADGQVGAPIRSGEDYTSGWDSVSAVDLNGDGRDEMLFYRGDGLYRYYDIRTDARIGSPIRSGSDYTTGWSSVSAVDLDGDGRDEMFFYRDDGLYRFYDIRSNGRLGRPIVSGDDYTSGWDAISAVDLDGDRQDEMFFYRDDGTYRFYNVRSDGSLGGPIRSGSGFNTDWAVITAVDLDGE
ncbi:MAG TPA: FG-GAP-like repeat-containing protein [Acidimicrobiia bacterium]|nr:FG-GAP-like repeat-containing protein [Acidimicrobiia bacterium]